MRVPACFWDTLHHEHSYLFCVKGQERTISNSLLTSKIMFLSFVFFLVTTMGQASGTCLKPNISWVSMDMLDTLYPVMDPYQCQAICVVTEGCTAFTWTTADNMLALHCYLFANISDQTSCEECVSGPSSCTCSSEVGCLGDASNIVDEILSVQTEAECQNFCLENPLCIFYTWFNADNTPANLCVLLNSCEDTSPCSGCFSGPLECSPEESTTTTITTPVIEGKFRFASLPLVGGIYQTSQGVIDQKMYFSDLHTMRGEV